jgi:hypothetical protein
MNDKKQDSRGLVVFIALFTLPFWFNMGKAAPAPELELTEKAKKAAKVCVRPKEYMKGRAHAAAGCVASQCGQQRGADIRQQEGKPFNMSLSNTCWTAIPTRRSSVIGVTIMRR